MIAPETERNNRKFGYTVGIALAVLAGFHIVIRHQKSWWVLFAVAMLLLVVALAKPLLLNPLRLVWDKIGHVLGIINTYVLLTLFYYLILSPLGLLMRLFGKDILKVKRSAKQNTYWEQAEVKAGSSMANQF